MRFRRPCSICSNPDARAVVDAMLAEQKHTLEEIGRAVAIHRSSVFRHSKKCVRERIADRVKSLRAASYSEAKHVVAYAVGDPAAPAPQPTDRIVQHNGHGYAIASDCSLDADIFVMIQRENIPVQNPPKPDQPETEPLETAPLPN